MADTYTSAYGFVKPEPGGSRDVWGQKWNSNLDQLDLIIDTIRDELDLKAVIADVNAALAFLATKLSPAFTGNGSIAGDFSIGGNAAIAGSLVSGDNFAFGGDLNTGFRRAGPDDFRIVAGGTDIARFTPGGFEAMVNSSRYRLPAGMMVDYAGRFEPEGWFFANGAAKLRSNFVELDTNIYCGDAFNPFSGWGYRCNDPVNPSTTRSITGLYIVLPDYRGVPGRAAPDNMGGVDAGRLTPLGDARNVVGSRIGANAQTIARANLPAEGLAISLSIAHPSHEYVLPTIYLGGLQGGGTPVGLPANSTGFTTPPPNTVSSGTSAVLGSGTSFNNVPLSNIAPVIIKY